MALQIVPKTAHTGFLLHLGASESTVHRPWEQETGCDCIAVTKEHHHLFP